MLVRAKETCIINASRQRAGSVFEWTGDAAKLPRFLEAVGDSTPAAEDPDFVMVAGKRGKRTKTLHDEVL